MSQHVNLLVVWSFLGLGASFVLFGAMRAAGDVMVALFVSVLSLWVIRLPFALALMPRFEAEAIWWSLPLGACVSILLTGAYYASGRWRRARLGLEPAKA